MEQYDIDAYVPAQMAARVENAGIAKGNRDFFSMFTLAIMAGVFIGSDTQLVAPVTVRAGAYVGAGTTVTKEVPPGALAVSRAPQKNIEGYVDRKNAQWAAEDSQTKK